MKRNHAVLLAAIMALGILIVSCGEAPLPDPPVAKKEAKIDTLFGHEMIDDYYWMRDRDNPEVIKYLEDENAYTDAYVSRIKKFEDKIYGELKSRIVEDDMSVPARKGDYYYYSREEEGKQYPIYCRKKGSLDAPEEILLDENLLAEGKDFMNVGNYRVSPNGNLLAYAVDETGGERYTIRVKNLSTGELLNDSIPNVSTSIEWAADNMTLFYMTLDETWRPNRLYRHQLGKSDDKLVFEEPDGRFWCGIGKTLSQDYLILYIGSKITTEYRILKADNPLGEFKVFSPRKTGREYEIAHHDGYFYILTNADGATNFKLMRTPVNKTGDRNWEEIIPTSDSVMIEGMTLFKNHMALFIRKMGQTMIQITDFRDNRAHYIEFEEPIYTVENSTNLEYDSELLRFSYTSMLTPQSIYDYNMNDRTRELKKQKEVPGYDRSKYEQTRIWAKAEDGTMIPMSICYPKGMKKDGRNYCYLYGYGAYGISYDPYFSTNRISLLDRGFIFALAHVRGGGVMGRKWYEDGKFLTKKNSFTDFIACAEYLIGEGYTSSDRMAAGGGSAGGLLMGAVANMRPDLFKVIVADVPFVDLMNTMLDESIPLTVLEYEEWGNPNDSVYFEYMLSYSPYDNVTKQAYPNMLITAGLNDPRVQYWEASKWTAKLRADNTGNNLILLKTNMGAGHQGASGRYDAIRELAMEYAFVLDVFGIKN